MQAGLDQSQVDGTSDISSSSRKKRDSSSSSSSSSSHEGGGGKHKYKRTKKKQNVKCYEYEDGTKDEGATLHKGVKYTVTVTKTTT
uniref:Uncharacterized protein n=1 Tax=Caenorhabditis japonica TaxID=281687 RepID=A0A8R1HLM7_CAEJA